MCVFVGGLSWGGVKAAKYLSKVCVSLSPKAAEKEGCDKTQIRDLRKKKEKKKLLKEMQQQKQRES